jgi:hypothetical protein
MKKKLMGSIIITALAAVCVTAAATRATATEFWETYSKKFAYNYAVKSGSFYEPGMKQKLTSHELLAVSSRSFSQSFGMRFSEVARSHRALVFVCIFSREPERCYLDSVMKTTFGEIQIIPQPYFSQKFVKKFSKFYTSSLMQPKSISEKAMRASGVPQHRKVNPRFGFSLNDFEPIAAMPFYTYRGIYVEPQWGMIHGPSLSFLKDRVSLDFDRDGAAFQYVLPESFSTHTQLKLTIRSDEIYLDNVFLTW